MKITLLLMMIIPLISGCSIVGTAVDIITTPIDLLTMDETTQQNQDIIVANKIDKNN
jgi:hypothetical protein